VYENRVLRRIFGPKEEEVAGGWRRLHNEELYKFHVSRNIFWIKKIKDEIGGECSTQETINGYKICSKILKRTGHSVEQYVDVRILLKLISEK
jgi:hypothetical protein